MAAPTSPPFSSVVTMSDVAAAAGVSHMTVSRVLRGVAVVSEQTAARVQAAVARLGYRPDPALSALAHRRRRAARVRAVGEDIVFLDCDGLPFSRLTAEAAAKEASWFGHRVETVRLPEASGARRRLARQLAHRRVEGLIIGPAPAALDLAGWDWSRFAAVAVGVLPHQPPLHSVSADYYQSLLTAEEAVRREGGRPGYCMRIDLDARSGGRWRGASLSCPWLPPPLLFRDRAELQATVFAWAKRHAVTVALTVDASNAPVFAAAGLKVAYLGHYNIPPGAAHLAIDPHDLGREAARLLHLALLRRDFGAPATPMNVGLRARWVPAAEAGQGARLVIRTAKSKPRRP